MEELDTRLLCALQQLNDRVSRAHLSHTLGTASISDVKQNIARALNDFLDRLEIPSEYPQP